jgi:hypothetical protein
LSPSSGTLIANALTALAVLAFWGYCLLDFSRTDEREMRSFSRPTWLALLVFLNVFGGIMWLQLGRPPRQRRHR